MTSVQNDDIREEIAWMTAIAAGDTDAFGLVLDRYLTSIFRFSYSLLRDRQLAEDISQEACLKLWQKAGEWEQSGRVHSWLLRIAHNLCIDTLRKVRPHVDIDVSAHVLPVTPAVQEQNIVHSHMTMTVSEALFSLPARQRAALMLVYYNDLTNIEAARIMDLSVDALESLLARGKRNLKVALAPDKTELMEG